MLEKEFNIEKEFTLFEYMLKWVSTEVAKLGFGIIIDIFYDEILNKSKSGTW